MKEGHDEEKGNIKACTKYTTQNKWKQKHQQNNKNNLSLIMVIKKYLIQKIFILTFFSVLFHFTV